jgi:hypothetical protein
MEPQEVLCFEAVLAAPQTLGILLGWKHYWRGPYSSWKSFPSRLVPVLSAKWSWVFLAPCWHQIFGLLQLDQPQTLNSFHSLLAKADLCSRCTEKPHVPLVCWSLGSPGLGTKWK